MKIAFLTNFYNHHQKPLADALYSMIGDDYYFIETDKITEERLNMGWGREEKPSYVINNFNSDEAREKCQKIIDACDVVILGNAPYSLITSRLKAKKLTFLYCERLYKSGVPLLKLPVHFLRALKKYVRHRNFYVLCASAYTSIDFSRTLSFIGKTYKWGYFPQVKKYDDINEIIAGKRTNSILWVARFIEWKHPEIALSIAKRLKDAGYSFSLDMIGNGELEDSTKAMIEENGLSDCVRMLGAMTPEKVREHMEKSEIFLFTSDRNEGWGAVLNESMNSACAVVANRAIGSVPFLVNEGENGYTYSSKDIGELYEKVKFLLDNPEERIRISKNACENIISEWNAQNAAEKLLNLCQLMLSGKYKPNPYETGVCSKARIIKDQ